MITFSYFSETKSVKNRRIPYFAVAFRPRCKHKKKYEPNHVGFISGTNAVTQVFHPPPTQPPSPVPNISKESHNILVTYWYHFWYHIGTLRHFSGIIWWMLPVKCNRNKNLCNFGHNPNAWLVFNQMTMNNSTQKRKEMSAVNWSYNCIGRSL